MIERIRQWVRDGGAHGEAAILYRPEPLDAQPTLLCQHTERFPSLQPYPPQPLVDRFFRHIALRTAYRHVRRGSALSSGRVP